MLLQEPVQAAIWDALNHYSYGDAIFLAERLNSEVANNETLHLLATCYYRAGRCNQAYMLLERSCCSTPQCKYLQAKCCADQSKYAEAERLIVGPNLVKVKSHDDIEMEFGSMSCYAFTLLGHIYSKTDRVPKSITCFRRALRLNPLLWKSFEMLCDMGDDTSKAENVFQIPSHTASAFSPVPADGSTPATTTANITDQISEVSINCSSLTIENAANVTGGSKNLLSPLNVCTNQTPENQNQPWPRAADPVLKAPKQPSSTATSTTQQQKQAPRNSKKGGVPTKLFPCTGFNTPSFGQLPVETPQPVNFSATPSFISPYPTEIQKPQAPVKARLERRLPARGKAPVLNWSNALKKMKDQETVNTPIRRSSRLFGNSNSSSVKENSKRPSSDTFTAVKPSGRRSKMKNSKNQEMNEINKGEVDSKASSEELPVVDEMLEMHQQSLAGILALMRIIGGAYSALARFECRKSIALFSHLPQQQHNTGWVMAQIGRAYYELTEYQKAAKTFEELRKLEPYQLTGLDFFSSVLWHTRKEVELSLLAQELQELDKMSAVAWFVTGNCFSLQKEHDVAIKFFQRAIQVDPSYVYAYSLLALEYIYLEEFDKALTCFRNAIRLDRRHYQAWYGVGMIYYKQEKFNLAEVHYRKALQINPSSSILMCHIGVAQHAQQKTDLALHTLNTAIKADPKDPLCMFHRASILFASDRHTEALEELETLKQIIPRESVVYFLMGKVHKKLGNTHLAMINFSWAMDLDPKGLNNQIKEAVDRHYVADDEEDSLARLEEDNSVAMVSPDPQVGDGVVGMELEAAVTPNNNNNGGGAPNNPPQPGAGAGGFLGLGGAPDLVALESDESL